MPSAPFGAFSPAPLSASRPDAESCDADRRMASPPAFATGGEPDPAASSEKTSARDRPESAGDPNPKVYCPGAGESARLAAAKRDAPRPSVGAPTTGLACADAA